MQDHAAVPTLAQLSEAQLALFVAHHGPVPVSYVSMQSLPGLSARITSAIILSTWDSWSPLPELTLLRIEREGIVLAVHTTPPAEQ